MYEVFIEFARLGFNIAKSGLTEEDMKLMIYKARKAVKKVPEAAAEEKNLMEG